MSLPCSPDNPEFLRVDDAEIVRDLITPLAPVRRHLSSEEGQHCGAELPEGGVTRVAHPAFRGDGRRGFGMTVKRASGSGRDHPKQGKTPPGALGGTSGAWVKAHHPGTQDEPQAIPLGLPPRRLDVHGEAAGGGEGGDMAP